MDEQIIPGCCCISDEKIFERGKHINGHRRARVVMLSGRYSDYAICGNCEFTPAIMASCYRRSLVSAKNVVDKINEESKLKARSKRSLDAIASWLADYASDPPVGLLSVTAPPPSDTILKMERADG